MFVYDIVFNLEDSFENNEHLLVSYLCSLSGNNQIIFETLNISGQNNIRVARVTVPYEDSLSEKYNNKYVSDAFKDLLPYLKENPEIKFVGEDFTYGDDICTGENTDSYVLCIHPHMRDISSICSLESGANIPYYLLPELSEDTMCELTSWDTNYAAYDKLFYATGIGEITAHKMMSNICSPLNQKGIQVCRKLENELGKDVYYYLYRFYGKHSSKCPICKGQWKIDEEKFYNYQCNKCKIVAHSTPEE